MRRLFETYAAAVEAPACFQGFRAEMDGLPGDYAPPRGRLLLARDGRAAIGAVGLVPHGDGAMEMRRLFVEEGGRGRGAGRALVRAALAEAGAAGIRRLVLCTLPDVMARAVALYRAEGFAEVPPWDEPPVAGALYMAKGLEGP